MCITCYSNVVSTDCIPKVRWRVNRYQPNLFPVEIPVFFFAVIVIYCHALRSTIFKCHQRPTIFKCHQPRTEKVGALSIDQLLNCLYDLFVTSEMTSTNITFQFWEIGRSHQKLGQANRQDVVINYSHFHSQHTLQLCRCEPSRCCPVAAKIF